MQQLFHRISSRVSALAGSPVTFLLALFVVIVWAVSGPLFDFSNTWQLIINTGTTIGTFLMVFLIQNTQNRDGKEVHLKLDEILRTNHGRNSFLDLDDLTDQELESLDQEFHDLSEQQVYSPTMKKLHAKLKEAHKRRKA